MKIELSPEWDKKMVGVIPCGRCKGIGVLYKEEMVSYHNRDVDYWNELCYFCDGEGRVIEFQYSFTVQFEDPVKKNKIEQNHVQKVYEKFGDRKISDIYKIGRN